MHVPTIPFRIIIIMSSIKIKVLLPALFAVAVLVAVLQGALGMRSVLELETQTDIIGGRLEQSTLIANMDRQFSSVRRLYLMALSASTAAEKKQSLEQLQEVRGAWTNALQGLGSAVTEPVLQEKLVSLKAIAADYDVLGDEFVQLIKSSRVYEARAVIAKMVPKGSEAGAVLQEMIDTIALASASDRAVAADEARFALSSTIGGVAIAAAVALAAALVSYLRVTRPIGQITDAMNVLASGRNKIEIPHQGRRDEIGEMAAAVGIFRDNALARERLEQETEAARSMSETERAAREDQKMREAAEVSFAVEALGQGLSSVADGDLTVRLDTPFAGQLDQLRVNFNESLLKLQSVLRAVGDNARMIDAGAKEITSAVEDLSKRTEQQAASVEETAAALEEVATAVKDSSVRAGEAGDLVDHTRAGAERSGEVVRQAVAAMEAIERSSSEIGNIIGVIDEIAFQTNLLALNAGVEAARAGDAGKGFAVVAQEVRELAQRSATAAREIKSLIATSGARVRDGVDLVGQTGQALEAIVADVQQINKNVASIVVSTREQSTGLTEISSSVHQMDQGTQQNAAMVEETTAATHSLATQATTLRELLSQFKLGEEERQLAVKGSQPVVSPARSLGARVRMAFAGGAVASQPQWSEF